MALFTGLAALGAALWSGLSGAIIRAVIGVGLSLLGNQLTKKKQSKTQTYEGGIKGTLQGGGDVARSFIVGRTVTAGSLVYANTWGNINKTPNACLTQVIALSDMPIQGVSAIWMNGEPITLGSRQVTDLGYPIAQYSQNLWIKFYYGDQTVADSLLTGRASVGRPYDASRIGKGCAYAVVTSLVEPKIFNGIPTFKFEIEGMKLYDPSKDSSIGGNGTHRLSDPSTWGGDGDHLPVVQIYNLLLGIYRKNGQGSNVWFYGFQNMSQARLPSDNWIKAVNFCREKIQGSSGFEERFLSGLEISVNAENLETLDALRAACNADLIDTGGKYRIVFAEPDAPVMAFTDGDIIIDTPQTFTPFFTIDRSINGITASYPEPNEAWNTKVATPVYNDYYEAKDGGRRLLSDIKLTAVYRWAQVQRLMESSLKAARRERKHVLTLPYKYSRLEVGDIIQWSSTRNLYSNKQFRIDDITREIGQNITITISEVDPSDFAIPETYTPPIFSPITNVKPPAQAIVAWYAEPSVIMDNANNARRPAIRLHWDGEQDDVFGVRYEVVLVVGGAPIQSGRIDEYASGVADIAGYAILPNTTYFVRGKYVSSPNRETLWSEWFKVKTDDVRLTDLDIYSDVDLEAINKSLNENTKWLGESQKYTNQQIERFDKTISDIAAQNYLDQQSLKRQISASFKNVRADYREEINVVANETKAVGTKVEELTAHVDNVESAFTEKTVVLASDIEAWANRTTTVESKITDDKTGLVANANAITTVDTRVTNVDNKLTAVTNRVEVTEASVGNVTASGLFRVTTEANGANGTSRIGLSASVTTAQSTKQAALFITADSASARSSVEIIADRFVLTNSNDNKAYRPFVIQNGTMYVQDARINWAKIDDVKINSAQIEDGAITNAKISNLIVGRSNLGFNSVTDTFAASFNYNAKISSTGNPTYPTTPSGSSERYYLAFLSTNNDITGSTLVSYTTSVFITFTKVNNNTNYSCLFQLKNVTTGAVLHQVNAAGSSNQAFALSGMGIDSSAVKGNNLYGIYWQTLQGYASVDTASSSLNALVWQR